MKYYKLLTIGEHIIIVLHKYLSIRNLVLDEKMIGILHKMDIEKEILRKGGYITKRLKSCQVIYNLNNKKCRINLRLGESSDVFVFEQLVIFEEYRDVVKIILQNNLEVETIIDLGSNIGLSALYFSKFFEHAQIYCVEPSIGNGVMLKQNLTKNLVKFVLMNNAIWSNNEMLHLTNNFRDGKDWSLFTQPIVNGKNEVIVQGITLDSLLKANNIKKIDLLKVDIEGAEKELFVCYDGIDSILKVTKVVVIEIHNEANASEEICSTLERNNFLKFDCVNEYTIYINKIELS